MDTVTKLHATKTQAMELQYQLNKAIKNAEGGVNGFVNIILEQAQDDGPWRLVIVITPDETEGTADGR